MPPRRVALKRTALCGVALLGLLPAAGCGGDSGGGGGAQTGQATTQAAKPRTDAVGAALKAQLEAGVGQLTVEKVRCTPRGEDFSCAVQAIGAGQPRKGLIRLKAYGGSGTVFLAAGRLAGPGGHIKFSRLVVDLNQPSPAKPPSAPGRSTLEDAIQASLQQRDPQLIITTLRCPDGKATGAGAKFTCTGKGPYGVSPATIVVRVTQTDAAGKRFVLSGTIDFTDPAGRKAHGSFRNVRVAIP